MQREWNQERRVKKRNLMEFLCAIDIQYWPADAGGACRGQLRHCKQGDVFLWHVGSMW